MRIFGGTLYLFRIKAKDWNSLFYEDLKQHFLTIILTYEQTGNRDKNYYIHNLLDSETIAKYTSDDRGIVLSFIVYSTLGQDDGWYRRYHGQRDNSLCVSRRFTFIVPLAQQAPGRLNVAFSSITERMFLEFPLTNIFVYYSSLIQLCMIQLAIHFKLDIRIKHHDSYKMHAGFQNAETSKHV